ncbi:GNAT family N-acetyltransferase [Novosphingobium profundi]|uniref:GNAT family N-acetyltransferase n=1 Tax=Novosphingobium profundi TaxID=1774954 RepID=UPI001BDB1B69|nr:GNAT family N-acetyltransferase [Novosphingobium profundi]MBT0669482.1 GNAT family N-acetyltransferase [Novosphingobium profundi]
MAIELTVPDTPGEAEREAVLAPLRAYNLARGGDPRLRPVAVLLTDEEGNHRGGLWGKCSYDWLFVELLCVPEDVRGQDLGTALMARAEVIAREQGCIGIWLDTFEFQARGFYEKLGFSVCGQIEDHPLGQRRYFLQKRLDR